ncbi:MAG: carboxypeptidase-like regulatory domain-containing protein [Chitinophagaceae bacterium]
MSGTILHPEGKPLAGATVTIVYAEAGISKTTLSQSNGSFLVPNLRVCGPYKVTASFVGYGKKTEDDIILELGRNTAVDFTLETRYWQPHGCNGNG